MKLKELFEDQKKLKLPDLEVGDEVKVGRFKNRKAEIKGFDKDDHGQPVLKTNKGDQKLFKPRVSKLEPKNESQEEYPYDEIMHHLMDKGLTMDDAKALIDANRDVALSRYNTDQEKAKQGGDLVKAMAKKGRMGKLLRK